MLAISRHSMVIALSSAISWYVCAIVFMRCDMSVSSADVWFIAVLHVYWLAVPVLAGFAAHCIGRYTSRLYVSQLVSIIIGAMASSVFILVDYVWGVTAAIPPVPFLYSSFVLALVVAAAMICTYILVTDGPAEYRGD